MNLSAQAVSNTAMKCIIILTEIKIFLALCILLKELVLSWFELFFKNMHLGKIEISVKKTGLWNNNLSSTGWKKFFFYKNLFEYGLYLIITSLDYVML